MERELHRIIYLAKNLKAFYLPGEEPESTLKEIRELKGRFRYRKVGVPTGVLGGELVEDPLVEVKVPPPFVVKGVEGRVSEVISLSSLFMTPVISSPTLRDSLEDLMCYRIRLKRALNRREFQFNLRLLTYIPVDLSVRPPRERGREALIRDCEMRFWRFREGMGEGEVRLGVIDPSEHVGEAPEWSLNPVGVIFLD